MKTVAKIAGASAMLIGLQGIAYAENGNDDKKEKVIRFSSLKVSGSQDNHNSPQIEAMEKPGAYSSVGEDNKLESVDSILRSLPGTYTQMDASQGQGVVSVNIRGLSGFGRVNMMVDGVSQTFYGSSPSEFAHGAQPYSQFGALIDPNFIVRVDISRGQADDADSINALVGSANFRTIGVDDVIFEGNNLGVRTKWSYGNNGIGRSGMMAFAGKTQAFSPEGSLGALFAVSGHNIEAHYRNADGISSEEFGTNKTFKQKPNSQLIKLNIKPNDFHDLELSGRLYHNKFNKRHIDNNDYYLKYHYTPFTELVDTKVMLSTSNGKQSLQGHSVGVLGKSEAKSQSDSINIRNTSRFNYGGTDFAFTLGSKWMRTEYRKKIDTSSDDKKSDSEIRINNGFAPSGKQDITSIYSRLKIERGIYTADLGLNYLDYSVKGFKPACEERVECFPQGEAQLNLKERGFNPNILLSAEIIPEFQPFVSYTRSMRAPNAQEIFHSNDGGTSINPFLKGEKAETYQIGFNSYRPNLIVDGDTFRLKATLFHTKIKNYISSDQYMLCTGKKLCKLDGKLTAEEEDSLNPNVSAYIYTNSLKPVTMKGYEISANYDAGMFYSSLAYSQQKTQQPTSLATHYMGASPESQLPERYLTLDTGIRLLDEKLRIGTIIKYTGQSYHQSPEDERDDDNKIVMEKSDKIPTIIDLYSDYQINKNLLLKFSVQNLTNRNYSDALNRMNTSPMMADQDTKTQTARGRTYVMGAEIRF
ncbi:TonB-dependent receptor domain-containing protein [Xenorhabdus griffiniae]|uniref:TonB-dependent receptor n=1 Tax=Xenorhabdus griffiniae TaxID=351672 RepID=A0ABY9XM98_9GAMM|nr:TonB-dependent receptor [Xenorhabdus griffiniae]MBD1227231.1 TonB-dependent receptor [Xenorhabdus griffiniae]MBE8586623.1 TonB-dependent receptor [Xenorhabdus griffiniae]WMV73944.1 TonB-dependent receptor [Xenorhabdus griffiniae]WNH03624.1 TonB-dependent receptor [Xenorhabdus griffiniae]